MSAVARNQILTSVHTIGGLLPADMLLRISEGRDVPGAKSGDYALPSSLSVRDAAERSWEQLKPLWKELRTKLPEGSSADPTGLATNDWLAPLFQELGFGRLEEVGPLGIPADGDPNKVFGISHRWQHVLVHLVAWNAELDRRLAGTYGGANAGAPPQSLVQECLNRNEAHLWGMLTNGRQIRLLRDSNALATTSYVEFDLEAIFDGELFSDFVLLYRLLHVSRFTTEPGAAASTCWLEKWRTEAIASGVRALAHLREGVQEAISVLGTGFLRHPRNGLLANGGEGFDFEAFHGALLRLVYRLIFLFVAEDRDLLHPPAADELARSRYATYFSTAKLRRMAARRHGTSHGDVYQALRIVLSALGDVDGRPELGLAGMGGLFDDKPADAPLHGLELANEHLLEAVRRLSRVRDAEARRWRSVDYRNMDSEELGSIYEWLLESVPEYSASELTFMLVSRQGNNRKKTGSYYTPSSLIEKVLDESLDPVIDDAVRRGEAKAAEEGRQSPKVAIVEELLSLTVCDPACGSAHFLVAAARRIAKRVAAVREANPEPTVEAVRHALHEVITRCIYGVDLNPMAVELAKVSLWLEALEPGKPLGFLDGHIKLGNALIGATPKLLKEGIPDKAFKPVEGDDPDIADSYATQNAQERSHQGTLFEARTVQPKVANSGFAENMRKITSAPSETLHQMREQEAAYAAWSRGTDYAHAMHVADTWCASFAWLKTEESPTPTTEATFQALLDPEGSGASEDVHDEIQRLREQYQFFHWHLEFPEIFAVPDSADAVDSDSGWIGGFTCVLGNPPWDRLEFEDKKYFSTVDPEIASLTGKTLKARIEEWETQYVEGSARYRAERRRLKSTTQFASGSGAFPLCARGLSVDGVTKLQVDQLFAELFTTIVAPTGRMGILVPSAVATSAGAQHLFRALTERQVLAALFDFENRKPLFPAVHSSFKFCILALTGQALSEPSARFAFFLQDTPDLDDPARTLSLAPESIAAINPNTGTLPVFRTPRDAELTAAIHRRLPILEREDHPTGNPWRVVFKYLYRSANDRDLLQSREELIADGWVAKANRFTRNGEQMMPMYAAKMVDYFNHRAADVVQSATAQNRQDQPDYLTALELSDPHRVAMPLRWVSESDTTVGDKEYAGVQRRIESAKWSRDWLCGWCDVTASTNERTAIPSFLPYAAVMNTFPLMFPHVEPRSVAGLIAAQSSLVFDFVARQKVSDAHMKLFIWKQLPVPTPTMLELHIPFILPRVLELVYTAYDMTPLARDLDDTGEPFHWDEDRRAQLRAELDAYFFHLYGLDRSDTDYVFETFQSDSGGGLKNNEIAKYGTYRTKDLVLAEYDRMAAAPNPPSLTPSVALVGDSGYSSPLDPPPGQGPRHSAGSRGKDD